MLRLLQNHAKIARFEDRSFEGRDVCALLQRRPHEQDLINVLGI